MTDRGRVLRLGMGVMLIGLAPLVGAAAGEPADPEPGAEGGAAADEADGTSAADDADGPSGAEPLPGSLAAALPLEFDLDRFEECAESPSPVLNEVCAVGTECDDDVRVADFVELYNPSGEDVDLGCFVLIGREGAPFVPDGELEPGEVRAWGEAELRWRIRKADDEIRLLRVTRGPDDLPELVPLESVILDPQRAHLYRSPNGGSWRAVGTEDAEYESPGTFDEANP